MDDGALVGGSCGEARAYSPTRGSWRGVVCADGGASRDDPRGRVRCHQGRGDEATASVSGVKAGAAAWLLGQRLGWGRKRIRFRFCVEAAAGVEPFVRSVCVIGSRLFCFSTGSIHRVCAVCVSVARVRFECRTTVRIPIINSLNNEKL